MQPSFPEEEDVLTSTVKVAFALEGDRPGYEIRIGPGLLDRLGDDLIEVCPAHRYVIIADSRVARLYGSRVRDAVAATGREVDLFDFPEGEANKTRGSWAALSDRMLEAGIGRDAAVLALGGGVTGDLAGFVAATYLRGLPLVHLPTSLLAMIDSSVGGKTGVDTPAGKNLIGAFLQPRRVLADTETLRTLAPEHVRSGLVEAIKHGAIADAEYFEWIDQQRDRLLELDPEPVGELIRRSVEIKARVVGDDEREGGLRKALNFGHTVGHAVEAESGFSLLHGEAIGIGMAAEARLGEAIGTTEAGTAETIVRVLARFGLPVRVPSEMTDDRLLALTRVDKKARGGQVEYALIERIGRISRGAGSYGVRVEDDEVRKALRT